MSRQARRILLVEGRDDQEVIYQLCNVHGLDNRAHFVVESTNGYSDLHERLQVLPKSRDVAIIGAVVDADLEPTQRWQSLRDALRATEIAVPEQAAPTGTIIRPPTARVPVVGLWMMPDNQRDGMLEDFLLDLAHEQDDVLPLARDAVAGIPSAQRRFLDIHNSKATIHTWLAWQADPGTPTGQALTKHYLDPHHPRALTFLAWLRELFMR